MVFIDKLKKKIVDTNVSDTTAHNHIVNILYIYKNIHPDGKMNSLTFLKKVPDILRIIKERKTDDGISERPISSQKTYLASIMKVLSVSGVSYQKLKTQYDNEFYEKVKILDASSNKKTPKQKVNWVSLDELKEVKDKYENLIDKWVGQKDKRGDLVISMSKYNELLSYLIVSLYTDIPPRRNEDYFNMKLVDNSSQAKGHNFNFYSVDDNKFIYRVFKTSHSHGEETQSIPSSLKKVIDLYLLYRPKVSDCFVVKFNGACFNHTSDWTRAVTSAFGKFLKDKNVSTQLIRNIYFTDKYKDDVNEMEETAKKTGTSSKVIRKYYVKED